jgi:hypothetical protein
MSVLRAASLLPGFAMLVAFGLSPAVAQDDETQEIAFGASTFTIETTEDFDRILSFGDEEIAQEFFVGFDRIAEVAGVDVAFFSVGPGGNACAPAALLAWQDEDGNLETLRLDDDCITPAPAVGAYDVFFVPYLLAGDTADIRIWNPYDGLRVHGSLSYAPQPDTGWADFDPQDGSSPYDIFANAEIYAAAQDLLGDDLTEVARSLSVSSELELADNGLAWGRGCVPHACTLSDGFVVIDVEGQNLYFAQQDEPSRFWPPRSEWPEAVSSLLPSDF